MGRRPSATQRIAHPGSRRWAFGAAFCFFATAQAFATDIPYSQGTVHFDDSRRVTVGVGGDYATCDAAYSSFPRNGPGGTIVFLPGDHSKGCGYNLGGRGDILITGQLGSNGERPRVTTPTFTRSNGSTGHEPFLSYSSNQPDILVVENLEIYDVGKGISAWSLGGLIVRNVSIDGTNGENGIKVDPTTNWQVNGPDWPTFFEIYDSEVAHAGSGNAKHNLYIGRIESVVASGLYTHSAFASHAYKSIAHNNTIVNSSFAVSDLAYAQAVNSPYLSSTLIDIAACANNTISDNTLIGFKATPADRPGLPNAAAIGGSTVSFIDVRRRKTSVGGCDDPKYGTSQANDPAFWANAAAGGYSRSNAELFHHDITNNTFINVGTREMFLVRNTGTAYMEDNASFNTAHNVDLALPDGWFERSVVWMENNTAVGDTVAGEEWSPSSYYPAGAPIFSDGHRVGTTSGDPTVPLVVNGGSLTPPTPTPTAPPAPSAPSSSGSNQSSAPQSGSTSSSTSNRPARNGSTTPQKQPGPGFNSQTLPSVKKASRNGSSNGFLAPLAEAIGTIANDFSKGRSTGITSQ